MLEKVKKTQISIIINIILCIVAIVCIVINIIQFNSSNSLKNEIKNMSVNIETLENERDKLNADLETEKERQEDLLAQIDDLLAQIDDLNNKLEDIEETNSTSEDINLGEDIDVYGDADLTEEDKMDIDQAVNEMLADLYPDIFNPDGTVKDTAPNQPSIGYDPSDWEGVGTPSTGELPDPDYQLGDDAQGLQKGTVY